MAGIAVVAIGIAVWLVRRRRKQGRDRDAWHDVDLDGPFDAQPGVAGLIDPYLGSRSAPTGLSEPSSYDPYAADHYSTASKVMKTLTSPHLPAVGYSAVPTSSPLATQQPTLELPRAAAGFTSQQIDLLRGMISRPDMSSQVFESVVAGMLNDNNRGAESRKPVVQPPSSDIEAIHPDHPPPQYERNGAP